MEKKTKPKMSCKAKAVDLLSRSDQSKGKLIQKLRRAKYEQEEIEEPLEEDEQKVSCDSAEEVAEQLKATIVK